MTHDGAPAIGLPPRSPLTTMSSTCLVPAKNSGLVSLCIQFSLLVVSACVSIFFFYHVGGYEYMGWNENSTILEPLHMDSMPLVRRRQAEGAAIEKDFPGPTPVMGTDFPPPTPMFNESEEEGAAILQSSEYEEGGGIDMQLPNTTITLPLMEGAELDLLELIRISTLVYLGFCTLWLFTLVLLLFSIKCEVLDFVAINAGILTVAIMYAFVHALFVAILLYYQALQHNIAWRTLAIVIGTVSVLVVTTVFGAFALALAVAWYKYIVYMHASEKCMCLAGVTRLIKGTRTPPERTNEYALPEATRHSTLPPAAHQEPIQQFSHF